MKISSISLFLAALAITTHAAGAEESSQELLSQIPQCSLQCMIAEIPKSGCGFTNTTCLCGSSLNTPALKSCILSACNTTEAIKLSRAQVGFCGLTSDKSRQTRNIAVLLALLGVCAVFVAVRVWIRIRPVFRFWIDDWLILVAFAFNCAYAAVAILQVQAKSMEHIWFLSDDDITRQTKLSYISSPITAAGPAFTKLSLLTFLLRIFPNKHFLLACKVMIGFVISNSTAMVLVAIFQCIPISENWVYWRYTTTPNSCINVTAFALAGSIINMIQDIMILILPIPMFLKLQLSLSKKLKLVLIFSAGLVTTIFAIIRFPAYLAISRTGEDSDPFWDIANILLYTTLEISLGIICACLPSTNAALAHFFPRIFGMTQVEKSSGTEKLGQRPTDHTFGSGSKSKSKNKSIDVEVCSLDRLSSKGLILRTETEEC